MSNNKTILGQHIGITGTLTLNNELILGDIHVDSIDEPGMIKWDGSNFLGYTGTSGWIELDGSGGGGESYIFSSGLTDTSGTITLGGTLYSDAILNGEFSFQLGTTTKLSSITTGTSGNTQFASVGTVSLTTELLTPTYMSFTYQDTTNGQSTALSIRPERIEVYGSNPLFEGITYNANVDSDNFTTTSLVHKQYVDDIASRTIIKSNESTANPARPTLNFITNDYISILSDSADPAETRIGIRLETCVDVDPTNRVDGSLWGYDILLDKTVPIVPTVFTNLSSSVDANLNANTQLTTTVPAGYKIDTIIVVEEGGFSAGIINIGLSALTTEIVSAYSATAFIDDEIPLDKQYFSSTSSTILFISSDVWTAGTNITLYFTLKKVI